MNEKIKNKIIIGLIIGFVISTGLCIYFGTANPSRIGEQLTLTVEQQRSTLETQRRTIEQLQSDLSAARESVESASRRADELGGRINGAIESLDRSIERVDTIARGTYTIIERQRLINEEFATFAANYRELKKRLGDNP
jgi:molybdopterin converting factor small subunit